MKDTFYSDEIVVREIDRDDILKIMDWRNQSSVRQQFIFSELLTYEQQVKWYENYCTKDNDKMFVAGFMNELDVFGTMALYNINFNEKKAEFGRLMIDLNYRGRGLGVKMLIAILKYGFVHLGLEQIYLFVFDDNKYALRTYLDIGFKKNTEIEIIDDRKLLKMSFDKFDYESDFQNNYQEEIK